MRLSRFVSGIPFLAVALLPFEALAQPVVVVPEPPESEYPLSYVERPLTLSRVTLAPELVLNLARDPVEGDTAQSVTPVGINVGATFGITRNWEIGAFFVPIQFTPEVTYGSGAVPEYNLQVFSTFRFLATKVFEMGARLRVYGITAAPRGAEIVPSVPMEIHLGKWGRIDAEVALPITAVGSSVAGDVESNASTTVGLNVPLSLAFDIIQPLHVGVSTGLTVVDFSDVNDTLFVPLGVFAGFAVGGRRPILDIDASFQWTSFVAPAAESTNTAAVNVGRFNGGTFAVELAAKGYFYFF